jgi:hypothetical protein
MYRFTQQLIWHCLMCLWVLWFLGWAVDCWGVAGALSWGIAKVSGAQKKRSTSQDPPNRAPQQLTDEQTNIKNIWKTPWDALLGCSLGRTFGLFWAPDISATQQSLCLFQRKCACGFYGFWGERWTAGAWPGLLGRCWDAVSAMLGAAWRYFREISL